MKASDKIIPTGDAVLVLRDHAIHYSGDIYLPDTALKEERVGTIIMLGTAFSLGHLLEVGDRVLLPEHASGRIKHMSREYEIFQSSDLLAKVD